MFWQHWQLPKDNGTIKCWESNNRPMMRSHETNALESFAFWKGRFTLAATILEVRTSFPLDPSWKVSPLPAILIDSSCFWWTTTDAATNAGRESSRLNLRLHGFGFSCRALFRVSVRDWLPNFNESIWYNTSLKQLVYRTDEVQKVVYVYYTLLPRT